MRYKQFNDDMQCIFIHVPKVAGISIATALFDSEVGHAWAQMYKNDNQEKFESYFKFAFVRNPYDRIFSAFSFLKRGGINQYDAKWSDENLSEIDSFESFVLTLSNESFKEAVLKWTHFIPQYKYVFNHKDDLLVDFLGRYEELDKDFKEVCNRLGRNCELPHHNKSENKLAYKCFYTPEMQSIVYKLYQKDFELLGYPYEVNG